MTTSDFISSCGGLQLKGRLTIEVCSVDRAISKYEGIKELIYIELYTEYTKAVLNRS